jgi:2-amino-4-hydroxy-6-hydroxymethyldihydropteridine diphosphokinase
MILDTIKAYLLLGSNLGDRELYLKEAIRLIAKRVGAVTSRSAVYETAAWGNTNQPGFLNLAAEVTTSLKPLALLKEVLAIEKDLGRIRHEKWGSRLIDIDIILYGDEIIDITGQLQIPHPEMQNRKFVMQPLVEIAPMVIHPILKQDLMTILNGLDDPLAVAKR